MHFEPDTVAVLYFLSSILPATVALINWRRREQPGATQLSLCMAFISVWMIFGACEMASNDVNVRTIFLILEYAASRIFVNFLFIFVIRFFRLDQWITFGRTRFLWWMVGCFLLLEATNPFHHLVWRQIEIDPGAPENMIIDHGPLYFLAIIYSFTQIGLILLILIREALRARQWDRQRAILMILALLTPVPTYVIYLFDASRSTSVLLMPMGLAISGLIFTLIAFEDMHRQVSDHTSSLNNTIHILEEEILRRTQLTAELLESREILASRLAEQSKKLMELYNLILLANKSPAVDELYTVAIKQIRVSIGSDMVCFYRADHAALKLQMQYGMPAEIEMALQTLPADWVEQSPNVGARINLTRPDDFSIAFARAGYGACMWKWVFVPDLQPALLAVFWNTPRGFAVEEIALFSALTDILAVIDETVRLRQASADRAIVQERRRLARDLHDSVTQSLHSLVLSAETAQQASATKPEQLSRILSHLVNSGRQALREMRLMLFELRLVTPFEIGLVEALTHRLEAVEHRAGITAKINLIDGAIWPLRWEKQLYPIAMEALNNSLKHAHASLVEVRLQSSEGQFEMQIVDNGCGFEPQNENPDGMGLITMRERAESIHARLEVFSQPGQGTRISLLIPTGEPLPPVGR